MAKSAIAAVPAPTPTIEGNTIRRDAEGRYSLNDLHKAAIAAGKATSSHAPAQFLRTDGTKAFIAAFDARLARDTENPASVDVQNCTSDASVQKCTVCDAQKIASVQTGKGRNGGTFAVELVAIRYAAWIDPSFEVDVYLTFQAAASQSNDWKRLRHTASSTNKAMNAVLQAVRLDSGKESAAHHYMNEALLVNEALSGKRTGLDRNSLSPQELDLLAYLESRNTAMIGRGIQYKERKAMIAQLATAWKFEHTMPKLAV